MKRNYLILLSFGIIAVAGTAYKIADDILSKLGVQKEAAESAIIYNLVGTVPVKPNCSGDCDESRTRFPRATLLAEVMTGDRKTAAKELCDYVKAYTESAAFSTAYHKERERNRPNEEPRKIDEAYVASIKENIAGFEAEYKKATDKQARSMYAGVINDMKHQLKEAQDRTPMTTAWNQKYPASLDSLIIRQLKFYLAEEATVDYAAQTVQKGRLKYFANKAYEQKGKTWKYIYRAGKEVNSVVKAFVTDWLKNGVTVAPPSVAIAEDVRTNSSATQPAGSTTAPVKPIDAVKEPVKEKKSLFKKIKEKINN